MTKWPAPVIRLFLGQLTPEAVLAAADNPNPVTKANQVCEANFYSGELALTKGGKQDASRLFRLATTGCPKNYIEWSAAAFELKALGSAK
jgi:lipoprotein NlpI